MTTATQYAVLACLLALITATPSFAQTRPGTAVDSGYPPYHCIPLKVDTVDELMTIARVGVAFVEVGDGKRAVARYRQPALCWLGRRELTAKCPARVTELILKRIRAQGSQGA